MTKRYLIEPISIVNDDDIDTEEKSARLQFVVILNYLLRSIYLIMIAQLTSFRIRKFRFSF